MSGFLEKLRDKALEIVLGIALTALIGGIVAKAEAMLDLLTSQPTPLAIFCCGAFLAGVVLSYVMGVRDVLTSRHNRKREDELKAEDEVKKAAERREKLIRTFRHGDYYDKLLAFYLHRNRVISLGDRAYKTISDWSLFEYQTSGKDRRDYWLKEDLRSLLDEQDELLLFCRPEGDVDKWLIKEMSKIVDSRWY